VAACAEPLDEPAADELIASFRERVARFPMGATLVALPVIAALRRSGRAAAARDRWRDAGDGTRRGERGVEPELVRLRDELGASAGAA